MNVFAKIFAQIFDSSIAGDYVVRHVFMDLLVLADREGVVDMTLDAISRRTNVPEEMVQHAISELMKPDRKSRSHKVEGCRITAIDSHRDWGWQIVNYDHYRNIRDEESRRTYFRDKKREERERRSQTLSNSVKDSQRNSTQGEGDIDTVIPPLPPSRGGRITRRQRQASVGSPRSKEAESADDALHAEQERKSYVMWQGMSEKYKLANPWLGAIPGAEVARSVS